MTSLELEEDERDRIWAEFTKNGSEIEKLIRIINYFVYLKDDELINEFPIESYNILKKTVNNLENMLKENEYTKKELFRYKNCLDDGYRVLNTSTFSS
jgi:hypothetical protein